MYILALTSWVWYKRNHISHFVGKIHISIPVDVIKFFLHFISWWIKWLNGTEDAKLLCKLQLSNLDQSTQISILLRDKNVKSLRHATKKTNFLKESLIFYVFLDKPKNKQQHVSWVIPRPHLGSTSFDIGINSTSWVLISKSGLSSTNSIESFYFSSWICSTPADKMRLYKILKWFVHVLLL